MRTFPLYLRGRLVAGLLITLPVLPSAPAMLVAQAPGQMGAAVSGTPNSARRTLTLADYGAWNRIVTPTLSPDGRWMAFAYQPNDGDATLHVRALDASTRYSVPVGSAPVFAERGDWMGYFVSPPARRPGAAGAVSGAAPGGGTPAQRPGPTPPTGARPAGAQNARRAEFRNLRTGTTVSVANAATFKFSDDGKWVAVRTSKAQADARHNGADLILHELSTGAVRNIGNVNQYEFDASGRFLAYTVDAAERQGNGVYLLDLSTGTLQTLSSDAKDYDQLTWSQSGTHLTALRGEKPDGRKQKTNTVMVWRDLGTPRMSATEVDASRVSGFPADMVISEYTTPRLSRDGSVLFLGIKEQEAELPRSEEPVANVDVWHYKDPEPQSVQIVRLQQERRSTWAAAYHLASQTFVRLADSSMRTVTPTPNGKWGIGRLDAPYRGEVSWGGSRADYYRVNIATGERTLIARGLTRTMGTSPDSKWFLFLEDGKVYAFNIETAQRVQVDAKAERSFVDAGDDHPYEKPTYGVAGWSQDGKWVLLNHAYDIWQLALDGSRAINLTGGVGEAKQIRFRLQRLDLRSRGGAPGGPGGQGGAPEDDPGVDLTRPLVYSAYGEWTKQSGYYQGMAGKAPTPLIYGDKGIGGLQKAARADRVIFTQQSFTEFPDWWTSSTSLSSPVRVTDANPQLAEFAWGRKVLVDYTNSKGVKLQGTLTLPASYEPGRKYPMIVYFYEKMSNTHHNFSMPVYDDRPHMSAYASDGYLVFQPDVVYETGRPGSSAVDCVTSAVRKVIELGYADPARIGLQGHSWGGYQTSFMITQTDMFAATVTGAPPTNLVSFYDQLYKQTGTVQQGIMELGQVRMGVDSTPWTAKALYESQSPVHNVQNIRTPFLILHGTADGAVDWVQGLEYFNAARRNGKNVIMLSYPDEPHHLARRENQKDFQIRMKQYFDHYLKGAPAPQWMTHGVPQVRKGEPIR